MSKLHLIFFAFVFCQIVNCKKSSKPTTRLEVTILDLVKECADIERSLKTLLDTEIIKYESEAKKILTYLKKEKYNDAHSEFIDESMIKFNVLKEAVNHFYKKFDQETERTKSYLSFVKKCENKHNVFFNISHEIRKYCFENNMNPVEDEFKEMLETAQQYNKDVKIQRDSLNNFLDCLSKNNTMDCILNPNLLVLNASDHSLSKLSVQSGVQTKFLKIKETDISDCVDRNMEKFNKRLKTQFNIDGYENC